jgi:phosphoserine phosphatase
MTRLHVFDMDGTLLRGAATVELSRHLGTFEVADAVERAWNAGQLTDLQFWESVLPGSKASRRSSRTSGPAANTSP